MCGCKTAKEFTRQPALHLFVDVRLITCSAGSLPQCGLCGKGKASKLPSHNYFSVGLPWSQHVLSECNVSPVFGEPNDRRKGNPPVLRIQYQRLCCSQQLSVHGHGCCMAERNWALTILNETGQQQGQSNRYSASKHHQALLVSSQHLDSMHLDLASEASGPSPTGSSLVCVRLYKQVSSKWNPSHTTCLI